MRSVLMAWGVVLAAAAAPGAAAPVAFTAAHMVDVVAGRTLDNVVVVSDGGRIVAVGPVATTPIPADARRVDLGGLTLVPGLIDMHVHLTADPTLSGYRSLEFVPAFATVLGVKHARTTLAAGFTTVRNVGAGNLDDVGLKQAIERGDIVGPRIIPATYAIGATGGHCDATEFPPDVTVPTPGVADGPDAIRATVRKLRKWGAEVIKFCGTGGVFSKTDSVGGQQYSQAEMDALVGEAHMLGMKVAVHAHGPEGIVAALKAGADTIEHASLANDEAFALAKAKGAWFSMDIYNDDYILAEGARNGVFAESLEKERQIGRAQRETFQRAVRAGVKMVFGSDAGVYPHGDNARQFSKMTEWGMTPLQALQAATVNAGEALGRAKDVGALAVGRYADIVAVAGDPTRDITLLGAPKIVIKGGEIVRDAR
ncbi:Xaa-Pro dipeptidase [alpha proteobacterium AAP81b]|nr:Xaa-Pro dipeptidase [alpha proteobacterium AAP81b]